jgi:hypothetical protein
MKDLKHIKRFNESEENLNISDVSYSEKLNKAEELLQSLVYLSQTEELKSFFENNYISAYMKEVEKFLDSL